MACLNPMEILYQRRCAKFIYVVPSGLQELMSDITREVLRINPDQVCTFIADYLDALLITRENAKVAARIVDHITESSMVVSTLIKKLNITLEEANHAAQIIQKEFRKHLKRNQNEIKEEFLTEKLLRRLNITIAQACHAAVIIQRAYRFYLVRMKEQESSHIDWKLASRRTIGILRKLRVPQWEMERAATLIKAAYKGYYIRKLIKDALKKRQITEAELEIPRDDSVICEEHEDRECKTVDYDEIMHQIQEHAAIVIQSAYRRHLRRSRERQASETPAVVGESEKLETEPVFRESEELDGIPITSQVSDEEHEEVMNMILEHTVETEETAMFPFQKRQMETEAQVE